MRPALILGGAALLAPGLARAASAAMPAGAPAVLPAPSSALQLAMILGFASLLPAIVLSMTCFARFTIVFSFLKTGLGTQGAPPAQVLVGLALFMTAFVMAPVATQVHERAIGPYFAGQLDEEKAVAAATPPLRTFLLRHTRQRDLSLFLEMSQAPRPATAAEVPLRVCLPAFTVSELRTAFEMGLIVLLPFLVIDLVVAIVLSSLGMMMLPPSVVSLPAKLLVFLAADGWHLIVESLLRGMA
jgi:flagellar biosynthetic protein FliP